MVFSVPTNESESLPQQVGPFGLGVFALLAFILRARENQISEQEMARNAEVWVWFPEFMVQVRHPCP